VVPNPKTVLGSTPGEDVTQTGEFVPRKSYLGFTIYLASKRTSSTDWPNVRKVKQTDEATWHPNSEECWILLY
jgi:hypothetical protein